MEEEAEEEAEVMEAVEEEEDVEEEEEEEEMEVEEVEEEVCATHSKRASAREELGADSVIKFSYVRVTISLN